MNPFTRRRFLAAAVAVPTLGNARFALSKADDDFLDDLSQRAFRFFWEQSDPNTGLVLDRVRADGKRIGGKNLLAASTAVTGFYLSALCIGHQRRWRDPNQIRERVRSCFRHIFNEQETMRGWYYHFVNQKTGERIWNCELSTIDSALLLAGVITAQQYFRDDGELFNLGAEIYRRVDFSWMLDPNSGLLRMGWFPETGFLLSEWASYDEESILYFLAIASPTDPIPVRSWYAFKRTPVEFGGYRFVGRGPIFTHQYSQAWMYLANLRDAPPAGIDYFQNSATATYAFRALWLSMRGMYPGFSENLWGVTPSDSDIGYVIWGSPSSRRELDGTVVPCAPAGSLMFAPEICLPVLRFMHQEFAGFIYGPYGFVDAFNPLTMWVNPDVIGIDVGMTLLSAENLRTGNVWTWFNRSPDVQRAMSEIFEPF